MPETRVLPCQVAKGGDKEPFSKTVRSAGLFRMHYATQPPLPRHPRM